MNVSTELRPCGLYLLGKIAKACFGVTPEQLCQIPAMLSIPGTYSVGCHNTRRKPVKLVSLKQAKELGIVVHGSKEAMETFVTSQNTRKLGRYRERTAE